MIKKRREEQTDSIEDALYELKLEIEDFNREEKFKFEPRYITEDMLQKKLTVLVDKAQNLINAMTDDPCWTATPQQSSKSFYPDRMT